MKRKILRFMVYNTTKLRGQWFWSPVRRKARAMYHKPRINKLAEARAEAMQTSGYPFNPETGMDWLSAPRMGRTYPANTQEDIMHALKDIAR